MFEKIADQGPGIDHEVDEDEDDQEDGADRAPTEQWTMVPSKGYTPDADQDQEDGGRNQEGKVDDRQGIGEVDLDEIRISQGQAEFQDIHRGVLC